MTTYGRRLPGRRPVDGKTLSIGLTQSEILLSVLRIIPHYDFAFHAYSTVYFPGC